MQKFTMDHKYYKDKGKLIIKEFQKFRLWNQMESTKLNAKKLEMHTFVLLCLETKYPHKKKLEL